MKVDLSDAPATREHRSTTYYFCSPWCAGKFDEDADAYLAAARLREADGGESADQRA
jgi:YHS domain-containing protein